MTLVLHENKFFSVVCDECGFEVDFDEEYDFWDVLRMISDDGWKSKKIALKWRHTCPDCWKK